MNKQNILGFAKSVGIVVVGVLLANVAQQYLAKAKFSKPLMVKEEE